MPIKLRPFLLTQPEDTPVRDLCSKAASRLIVNRLYPEDDDSAFNELRATTTKGLFAGIEELTKGQSKFSAENIEDLKETSRNPKEMSLNEMFPHQRNKLQSNFQTRSRCASYPNYMRPSPRPGIFNNYRPRLNAYRYDNQQRRYEYSPNGRFNR